MVDPPRSIYLPSQSSSEPDAPEIRKKSFSKKMAKSFKKMGTQVKDLMTPRGSSALIRESGDVGVEASGGSKSSMVALLDRSFSGSRRTDNAIGKKKKETAPSSADGLPLLSQDSQKSWSLASAQPQTFQPEKKKEELPASDVVKPAATAPTVPTANNSLEEGVKASVSVIPIQEATTVIATELLPQLPKIVEPATVEAPKHDSGSVVTLPHPVNPASEVAVPKKPVTQVPTRLTVPKKTQSVEKTRAVARASSKTGPWEARSLLKNIAWLVGATAVGMLAANRVASSRRPSMKKRA